MIHDAKVEISCDNCYDSVYYECPWLYTSYSGKQGYYDSNEDDIRRFLHEEGWIITNEKSSEERHFCCKDCYVGAVSKGA